MTSPPAPCTHTETSQFDFWLGEWDLTWPAEQTGGRTGETAFGTNRIGRLFGRCAVEENFATEDASFLGRSLSVYDSGSGMWRQTWVDNTGTYLLVSGSYDGEVMELRTAVVERDGESIMQRMVFSEMKENSLHWEWQGSRDAGNHWNDLWTISYSRRI